MKLSEHLEGMDPKLTSALERAMAAVREEFEQKLVATVEQTVAAAAAEAAAAEQEAARTAVPETPAPSMSLDAADELRLAALDIDAATSQSEILEALSRGVLRFASRVAIFVNRGEEAHGWSATGFGEADARIKQVSLGGDKPFPMSEHLSEGSVALSSDDCALIGDALGVENAAMGLLLPFVLGSQVVGIVYCDRVGEETFSVSALQLLTYIAGQTLETLPVRKRDSTVTLALAGSSVVADTIAPAFQSAPPQAPAAEEAVESVAEPAPEPAPETAAEPVSAYGAVEAPIEEPPIEEPPIEEPAELPAVEAAPAIETTEPPAAISKPSFEALPAAEDAVAAIDDQPAPALGQPTAHPVEPGPEPHEPALGLSSTQVAPPSDLQGPGWAFASATEQSDAGSESENEEAQRLARLLVTEIKLYNEEAVEAGRRDGDVYSRLREDIDRSRQIFEDRIDPAVRNENDYFKQALVRILAGGDPSLLGI